ncbi:MAG TPA: peroxiredoxin [Actinomycetota bacterium]
MRGARRRRDERELVALPPTLPIPEDDGGARHLPGVRVPDVALASTEGGSMGLADLDSSRTVVYCYPRTGRPGEPPLREDWDRIPGARGCTAESCAFRDRHAEIASLGVGVYGVSTQAPEDQREAARRLRLRFPLLSDAGLELVRALRLPTFEVAGRTLLKRLTLIVRDGRIEHVWYPVFPPDRHAEEVLGWLRRHPIRAA